MTDKPVWRAATIEDVNACDKMTDQLRAFLASDQYAMRRDFDSHEAAKRERNKVSASVSATPDLRDKIIIKLRGNTVFVVKFEVE